MRKKQKKYRKYIISIIAIMLLVFIIDIARVTYDRNIDEVENAQTSNDGNIQETIIDENGNVITTDTNVNNIGQTTISKTEEQDKLVSESYYDMWKPIQIDSTKTEIDVNQPEVIVRKSTETTIEGNEIAYAGQEIKYLIDVTNNSEDILENIEITDKISPNTTFDYMEDMILPSGEKVAGKTISNDNGVVGVKWVVSIPAGESVRAVFAVKANEEEGTVSNIAIANGQESNEVTTTIMKAPVEETPQPEQPQQPEVPQEPAEPEVPVEPEQPEEISEISIDKEVKAIEREGQTYRATETVQEGDIIRYNIKVKNEGNTTIKNINIAEELEVEITQGQLNIEELAAGQEEIIEVAYTVKNEDIKGKEERQIKNKVKVEGTPITTTGEGQPITAQDETNTEIKEVSIIDVEKTAAEVKFLNHEEFEKIGIDPETGKSTIAVGQGDIVKYEITVTNMGNTTIRNIKIKEKLDIKTEDGAEKIPNIKQLKPGESTNINVYYTVTEKDVEQTRYTFIKNEVKVSGRARTKVEDTDKDETVEINPNVNIPVSKIWPSENKHNIQPDSITVRLFKTVNEEKIQIQEKELSKDNKWSTTFEKLPKYDENKNEITYTVEEMPVGGYTSTITGNASDGFVIINTDEITEQKLSVVKRLDTATNTYKTVKAPAEVGDIIEYTIKVSNGSDEEARLTVTDTLPEELKILTENLNVEGSTITWKDIVIPGNSEYLITFEAEVTIETIQKGTIVNIATVGNTQTEPNSIEVRAVIEFVENGGTTVKDITGAAQQEIENREMPETKRLGYTFDGWYDNPELTGNSVTELLEKIPAGTTYYYAKWVANTDIAYKVEHHLQNVDGNGYTLDVTEHKTGTTGEQTEAQSKEYIGFTAQPFNQDRINEDCSTVIKIYYNRNTYTVTYNPGTQGVFTAQTYNVKYEEPTPEFKGKPTGNSGYNFKTWDKEIQTTVTENSTYTAIWQGLEVTKTRTEIIDKDKLGNTTFVDQEGDIIKYTITVTNIGEEEATGIELKDDHAVTVTSVKKGETVENIFERENHFAANTNLLEGVSVSLKPSESIEVAVEYKITEKEITSALKNNKNILNTATAILDGNQYTGTQETEVKQRCEYRIEYHYNGKLGKDADDVIESAAIVGATISFERPSTRKGYQYINYKGSTTVKEGENLIIVNYGKAVTTIEKRVTKEVVDAAEEIEYAIIITNTGYIDATVNVVDELQGVRYVADSANIGNPTITGTNNQLLTWNNIKVSAASDNNPTLLKAITFRAKTKSDSFGDTIPNTANLVGGASSNTVTTNVNEVNVKYNEFVEGQKGSDLNIIFILDNSSSMNEPIEGQKYTNNGSQWSTPLVAPDDEPKTRLYNAKTAIKGFIDTQNNNPNTSMTLITFNKETNGVDSSLNTLVRNEDIKEKTETVKNPWGGGTTVKTIKYVTINEVDYEVSSKTTTATDGKQYYYVQVPIQCGAVNVGTNAVSNADLKEKVNNITISSARGGFGTNVAPAFKLINDNTSTYISNSKKNIVIVLADGVFNDNYDNQLKKLKEKVDEIYCIGFGSGDDYDSTSLAKMATDGKCHTATNASTLLDVFSKIEESASSQQSGTTTNGSITFEEATLNIKISEDCPIVGQYATGEKDNKGNDIMATLFECKSTTDLSKYGLSISKDGKTIIWDAKTYVVNSENPETMKVPSTVYIKYYIPRTAK